MKDIYFIHALDVIKNIERGHKGEAIKGMLVSNNISNIVEKSPFFGNDQKISATMHLAEPPPMVSMVEMSLDTIV